MIDTRADIRATGRYRIAEACELLQISRRTLQRWVASGSIKPRFFGPNRRPYFTGSELTKVLNDFR